jgi:hypothetical protein
MRSTRQLIKNCMVAGITEFFEAGERLIHASTSAVSSSS